MKTIMIMLVAVSITMGGCMRPMNNRPPRDQHTRQKQRPPLHDQPGPDRRPGTY